MHTKKWIPLGAGALAISLLCGAGLAGTMKRITAGTIEASNDIWRDRAGLTFAYAPSPPPIDPAAPSPPPIIFVHASRFAGVAEELVILDTDGSRLAVVSIPPLVSGVDVSQAPVTITVDQSKIVCEGAGDPASAGG
jgi:hypothetical protein